MSGAHDAAPSARPWVNRERELATIGRVLAEAVAGRPRVVVVSGEAGIGKTRLADEVSRRAPAQGARALWGRCWEGAGAPAYWPWVQILRAWTRECPPERLRDVVGSGSRSLGELVGELRERVLPNAEPRPAEDDEDAGIALFESVRDLFTRAAVYEPLLLVIDDLQWADPPSLRLLRFLVHASRETRLVVLATCRTPLFGSGGEAARLLAELRRESLEIPLGGLGADDVAALLAVTMAEPPPAAVVRRVYEATEGNPFFVDEIARGFAAEGIRGATSEAVPIPEGIRQAIRWRLSVLAPESLEILSLAAVIGRSFDRLQLCELSGRGSVDVVKRLGEASRLDVVRPSVDAAGEYVFSHGLVRETLYEDVPPARRAEVHRRIGELLEACRDADERLAALAHHFAQAAGVGCAEKAVAYGFEAGCAAEARLAWEEAARCFAAVLGAFDALAALDAARRREAWIRLAENQARAGDRRTAAASFQRAIELARTGNDPERQARAALGFAASSGSGAGADEASRRADVVGILEDALARFPEGDSGLRARLLGRLAAASYEMPGSRGRRIALSDEAASMARRVGDAATLAAVLDSRRHARWGPDDLDDRRATAAESLRLAREAGDRGRELQALRWRVWDDLESGQIDDAWRHAGEHAALARRRRRPSDLAAAFAMRALRAMLEGRYGEARRLAVRAFEIGSGTGNPVAVDLFAAQRFVLAWEEGRLADLEDAMATILSHRPSLPAARASVPFVRCLLGQPEAARAELERLATDDLPELPRDLAWPIAVATLSLACVSLGDAPRCRRLYEWLLPYRDRFILLGPPPAATLGPVEWVLGRLAHADGRPVVASQHLERAIDIATRIRAPGYRARALVALAVVRAELGDSGPPAEPLDEGRALARHLGMEALEAEARTLAERIGARASGKHTRAGASLRHEGDFWLVGWQGCCVRVEDAKGVRYLARLLRSPGTEVHVTDLMRELAPVAIRDELRPGHAGDDLDARAAAEYRRRLAELERALAAGEASAPETVEALRAEADFIRRELAAAHGLGGRRRRSVDDVERLRKTVSSRIRQSAERIGRLDPVLGEHLRESVRTGTFCVYEPRKPVRWAVEE